MASILKCHRELDRYYTPFLEYTASIVVDWLKELTKFSIADCYFNVAVAVLSLVSFAVHVTSVVPKANL
jgi:hypothetical protein